MLDPCPECETTFLVEQAGDGLGMLKSWDKKNVIFRGYCHNCGLEGPTATAVDPDAKGQLKNASVEERLAAYHLEDRLMKLASDLWNGLVRCENTA